MLKRTLTSALTLAALAAAATSAAAADPVVVPGATVQQMAALNDNVVWVTGTYPKQTLMRRDGSGSVAAVQGAPRAYYPSIDLGITASGRLVLTYIRCLPARNCKAFSDDLAGRRSSYKRLTPKRCELTSAPSRWRNRVAYGLRCDRLHGKPKVRDAKRSGVFVRKGSGAAKRLRLPKDATRFGISDPSWVDLRGTTVGAVVSDIYAYAFTQTVNGSRLRSTFVAGSEGETDEHVAGLSLGSGARLWALVDAIHVGDPNQTRIHRLGRDGCVVSEALLNAPEGEAAFEGFVAEAMAVDGNTIYLYEPGTGIATHEFAPSEPCS